LFARPLGGIVADKIGKRYGFDGKTMLLSVLLLLEGAGLLWFAQAGQLSMAIVMMFFFGLSLKMANGATYSLVPFVNTEAVGSVAGIVGAGGNIGAMLIGFLFKYKAVKVSNDIIDYSKAFTALGFIVLAIGIVVLIFRTITRGRSSQLNG
jgi:NNP family nitrate/nitrite transporter-like MFS transporter